MSCMISSHSGWVNSNEAVEVQAESCGYSCFPPSNDLHHQYLENAVIDSENSEMLRTTLSSLANMKIDNDSYVTVCEKDEMVVNLIDQVKELEVQSKEQREWAQKKAIQAARKLSSDLIELKSLRMEREEMLRMKGSQATEDTTIKRLSEMEKALRKASSQVDHANAAVRQLEIENAEIRAEMEAAKLSTSESLEILLEIAKKEKKCLKKCMTLEKQTSKLQQGIIEENKKISFLQEQFQLLIQAQRQAEIRCKEEMNAKELLITQLEERRSVEAVSSRKRQEALHYKIEIDYKRYEDDVQRLKQELSCLKASAEASQQKFSKFSSIGREPNTQKASKEPSLSMHQDTQKLLESPKEEVGLNRTCLICLKDEVCVVFLPCAHQILCAICDEAHEKAAKTNCPCCGVKIKERIHVYGASS